MTLFEQIADSLTEAVLGSSNATVTPKKIKDAITRHKVAVIRYRGSEDETGAHTRKRMIMPVTYGRSTAGNDVVRAYQVNGDTNTVIPRWKLFRVDGILSWENKRATNFNTNDLGDAEAKYRADGDEQMATVYIQANIGRSSAKTWKKKDNQEPKTNTITPEPVSKKDVEQQAAISGETGDFGKREVDKSKDEYYSTFSTPGKETVPKMTAPVTSPVAKADIEKVEQPQQAQQPQPETQQTQQDSGMRADDSFVSKADIENANSDAQDRQQMIDTWADWNRRLGNTPEEEEENNF